MPKFASKAGRKEHRDELDRKLSEWTRKYTAKQVFRLLQEAGVAAGIPSSGEDLFHDIHLRARGHIVETEAQPWGKITHHGLPGIPSLSAARRGPAGAVDRRQQRSGVRRDFGVEQSAD